MTNVAFGLALALQWTGAHVKEAEAHLRFILESEERLGLPNPDAYLRSTSRLAFYIASLSLKETWEAESLLRHAIKRFIGLPEVESAEGTESRRSSRAIAYADLSYVLTQRNEYRRSSCSDKDIPVESCSKTALEARTWE